MKKLLLALLVCLLATLAAPPAGSAANADKVFRDGKALFDKGQYEGALPKFREALGLTGSPNARLYLARCLQNLGRLPEAYDEMQLTMREAAEKAATDSKYVGTRDAAAAQIAIMDPQIGKLVIALVGAGESVAVSLDDVVLTKERIGVPIPVEPKTLHLKASESGKQTAERNVEVRAGKTETVTLELKAESAAPATSGTATDTSKPPVAPEPEGPSELTPLRIVGIVATIVGVGGGVAFGVTGSMVLNRVDQLDQECPDGARQNVNYESTVDEGKTLQLIANIGLGVGIAGIAAGVALLIFGGPDESEEPAPASPVAAIGPDGAVFGFSARF